MDVFGQFLDRRDGNHAAEVASRAESGRDAKREAELLIWLNQGVAPEVRLLKFDAWIRVQLETRLDWAWARAAREKRIEQCRLYLERLVLDMWRRGWMLDGKKLAAHLESVLDSIGKYQRTGAVLDFWPYFRSCVDRYVGANAEEIRVEAMRAGSHVNQLLGALGVKAATGPTLPELIAQRTAEVEKAKEETLRERMARARRRDAACKADAQQQLW